MEGWCKACGLEQPSAMPREACACAMVHAAANTSNYLIAPVLGSNISHMPPHRLKKLREGRFNAWRYETCNRTDDVIMDPTWLPSANCSKLHGWALHALHATGHHVNLPKTCKQSMRPTIGEQPSQCCRVGTCRTAIAAQVHHCQLVHTCSAGHKNA